MSGWTPVVGDQGVYSSSVMDGGDGGFNGTVATVVKVFAGGELKVRYDRPSCMGTVWPLYYFLKRFKQIQPEEVCEWADLFEVG